MQLSRASTIAEWREACDLLPWRELATAYNQLFQIECSPPEWKTVLVPAKERTLGDVCELLACHARIPRVREVKIFGAECLHAGAILTIRALLQEAGANCREITPSTPIAGYARRYFQVFLGPISWLAPGALPPVKTVSLGYDLAIAGMIFALVMALAGAFLSEFFLSAWLIFAGISLFVFCCALTWFVAETLTRVEFGELKTFRDLASAIAGHRSNQ